QVDFIRPVLEIAISAEDSQSLLGVGICVHHVTLINNKCSLYAKLCGTLPFTIFLV
ncbi:MAG: hypothetical protein RLZZ70_416, partial [Candidatus Parcubacteria bacterium]